MLRAWKVRVEEEEESAVREAVVSANESRAVEDVGDVGGGASASLVAAIWVRRDARRRRRSGAG